MQEKQHTLSEKEQDSRLSRQASPRLEEVDGLFAARVWKWARQDVNSHLKFKLPLERITAKCIYENHREAFDKLARAFASNGLSPVNYLKFFATVYGGAETKLDDELCSKQALAAFETWKATNEKRQKIFSWFMKSVHNIVDECIEQGWFTTKDFMRHLINEKKLAGWYASGKISKYYLAAIPNFWKIVPKLDHFAKEELKVVADRYDMYNTEVNEAFLQLKKFKVNPIALTDALIYEKRHGIREQDGYLGKNGLL